MKFKSLTSEPVVWRKIGDRHFLGRHWAWGLALLTLLPRSAAAQADWTVEATISSPVIQVGEGVQYTLSFSGQRLPTLDGLRPPDANGLVLLQQRPNTSQQVSIVNGSISRSLSYSWTYRGQTSGTARIDGLTIRAGGVTRSVQPINIEVVDRVNPGSGTIGSGGVNSGAVTIPSDAPSGLSRTDAFIDLEQSRRTAALYEQVVIDYYLYFRDGIQLRQSRLADSWDAEGFWREDLDVDSRPIPERVVRNGLRYNRLLLKRAAIFPTRAGRLSVDSLKIGTQAFVPVRTTDPFSSFFGPRGEYVDVVIGSPAVNLTVNPLPSPVPPSFSGAVGQLAFEAQIDRSLVEVGNGLTLTLTVRGAGNIAVMDAPELSFPGVFEVYEPEVESSLNRSGAMLTGVKTFTYLIVPRSNGDYELPAIDFTFFNTRSRQYETISRGPFPVRVEGEADQLVGAMAAGAFPVDDVAPVVSDASPWAPIRSSQPHRSALVYLLLGLPFVLWGVLAVLLDRLDLRAADVEGTRRRRAHPLALKALEQSAAQLDGDGKGFYQTLEHAVLGFIGNRLNVSERGLTRLELRRLLSAQHVDDATIDQIVEILDVCDAGRYAPVPPNQSVRRDLYDQSSALLTHLMQWFKA